ncbi:ComF family protein [Candidatus Sumerlaeota bacterium]|nr:ComF family protein [Candidatus Sumerlaeota bacterium]
MDLLYPPACPLCQVRLNHVEQILCDPCREKLLPIHTWRCPRCGATGDGPTPTPGHPCPKCPPPDAHYKGVLSCVRYNDLTGTCVQLFKYQRRLEMGRVMGDLMAARLSEPLLALDERIQWIVPVPLHWTRRAVRGFNQSQILARRLADAIKLPLVPALRRIKRTKMQTRIPKEKREENVRGAFAMAPKIRLPPPGILIVDDVVTSGHTLNECARVLTLAGAPQVWAASFARA